jgi:hypothetical protein
MQAGKHSRSPPWTLERVRSLAPDEIEQLRGNASALGAHDVVGLCDEASCGLAKRVGNKVAPSRNAAKSSALISRAKAFEARGVRLEATHSSWSAVRKSDGVVVMTLWASAIRLRDGACNYLLWAPNLDGSRPWYDTPAGRERLKHCQLVAEGTTAEGLVVHGEALEGRLPEDKVRSVRGVDPEAVLRFHVEKRNDEYWAVWGKSNKFRAAPTNGV